MGLTRCKCCGIVFGAQEKHVGKKVLEIWPEEVRAVLDYAPETGAFTWKVRVGNQRAGSRAETDHSAGYLQVSLFGRAILAHRLAWFYVHGTWPVSEIDHVNRQRTDNRISNLREATRSQNGINNPIRKNNTSGVVGVSWSASRFRWTAQIVINKKCIPLGRYINKEDAISARKQAETKYHGNFSPFSDGE